MPEAQTLNCPMCGAPASTDSTRCEHCGARLATVACPSCFGMMFAGAKFCSHCGARAARTEISPDKQYRCPRCRIPMTAVVIGNTDLIECPKCEGLWADKESVEQICADREKQSAVLGAASHVSQESNLEEKVRYLPCPVCNKLMNRVNFAHCSHVIIDVCTAHGTWFDRDELRQIVEFIRAGGLDRAREREIAELERQRRELKAEKTGASFDSGTLPAEQHPVWEAGLSAAAEALIALLK